MKRYSLLLGGFAMIVALVTSFALAWNSFEKDDVSKHSAVVKQLWHCGMHPQVIQDHPGDCPICHMALTPLSANGGSHVTSGDVEIDPRVAQNMGVRTAVVTKGTLSRSVRTVGILALPDTGLRDVSLKVNGWIQKLYVDQEGMHVQKGDPLFELYSPDLLVAAQELSAAEKARRSLPTDAADSLKTESDSLVETTKRKLRLWDVSDEEIEKIVKGDQPPQFFTFRSPAAGHVEEKMVVEGGAVQAGMKLFRIADHSKMWVLLEVYPEAIPLIKQGQEVIAHVEGMSQSTFKGSISFVYPHLDHMTRTLKVRATLDNPGFELKPGMYATAEFKSTGAAEVVLCPKEAVIDSGAKQIAFVAEGNGHFSARSVRVGQSGDGDKVQILEGLSAGESVVTSGQFLIDVESRTNEAVQKLAMNEDSKIAPQSPNNAAQLNAPEKGEPLVQVYCPMVKANWLQRGEQLQNPYMGQKMLGCGEAKGTIQSPDTNSPLVNITDSYLKFAESLTKDVLDKNTLQALREASDRLSDKEYRELKESVSTLVKAGDIKAAREALKGVSEKLAAALSTSPK